MHTTCSFERKSMATTLLQYEMATGAQQLSNCFIPFMDVLYALLNEFVSIQLICFYMQKFSHILHARNISHYHWNSKWIWNWLKWQENNFLSIWDVHMAPMKSFPLGPAHQFMHLIFYQTISSIQWKSID